MRTKIDFEKLQVCTEHSIPYSDLIDNMDIEQFYDPILNRAVYRLHSYVLGHRLIKDTFPVTFEIPCSWWQMFKRDVLKFKKIKMKWLHKTIRVDEFVTYPESKIGKFEDSLYLYTPAFGDKAFVWQDINVVEE